MNDLKFWQLVFHNQSTKLQLMTTSYDILCFIIWTPVSNLWPLVVTAYVSWAERLVPINGHKLWEVVCHDLNTKMPLIAWSYDRPCFMIRAPRSDQATWKSLWCERIWWAWPSEHMVPTFSKLGKLSTLQALSWTSPRAHLRSMERWVGSMQLDLCVWWIMHSIPHFVLTKQANVWEKDLCLEVYVVLFVFVFTCVFVVNFWASWEMVLMLTVITITVVMICRVTIPSLFDSMIMV